MLKKVQSEIPPPPNAAFQKRVMALADEGHSLVRSYADLSARMLRFAADFRSLWDQAKSLDKADNGQHSLLLREHLADIVQSQSPSVWSKWNTIGAHSKALLPYKDALPPQRECLYELAIAAGENKPIDRWVADEKLTSNSTVREVAALRKPKKRKRRAREYLATVTLRFDSYDDAAETLKELVLSDANFKVKPDKAFHSAIRSKVEDEDYEGIKNRFE